MSKLGDLNHEAKKKKLAAEIHKKKQSKKASDRFLDILENKIWFPIIFGVVSVASATLFLNHYFVGSSELLQFITIASLCLAMLLELCKYWCLNHFFDALSAENLADGEKMLYQPLLLGFFSLCCIALSVTLSIGGVSLYGEESAEKIAEITQKQVTNMVNIDSINQYFENVKNEKKAIFQERENDLNSKIAKLKNESNEGGAWSPIAKSNAKIIGKIEEKILENQNDFSEQIAQIEGSQAKHLEAADKKNEQNRVRTIDKEVFKENEKTAYNWKITAFCEGFSLLIAVFIAILEQQVAKETRLENENLKQNSKPILIDEEESTETEIHMINRKLDATIKELKMYKNMAIDTPYTPVNSPVNEQKNPIGFQNRQGNSGVNTPITLYDGKVIHINQYKGSFHRTCFHCGKAIHEQKENAFSCSDACYQNFTQKYGTLKDILGSSSV